MEGRRETQTGLLLLLEVMQFCFFFLTLHGGGALRFFCVPCFCSVCWAFSIPLHLSFFLIHSLFICVYVKCMYAFVFHFVLHRSSKNVALTKIFSCIFGGTLQQQLSLPFPLPSSSPSPLPPPTSLSSTPSPPQSDELWPSLSPTNHQNH